MHEKNLTRIIMIHIVGFQSLRKWNILLFIFFLLIFLVTLCGNLLIITLVAYSKVLRSPMYFFLSQLSVSDILLIADISPKMLSAVLVEEPLISLLDCITQFYFFAAVEGLECFLLSVMSYDRYLAICKPLHYTMIMRLQVCWIMIVICWILSFFIVLIHAITVLKLQYCGPYIIDHFFCDLDPILQLSCGDTSMIRLEVMSMGIIVAVFPFLVIIISYIYIIFTIMQITSITGRQKVFSTCSSHLIVVSIYYITLISVYMVPNRAQSRHITKFFSLLYTVLTPLLNPIIYSLRNKDLKDAAGKLVNNFLNLNFNRK